MFRASRFLLIAAVLLFGEMGVSAQQPLITSAWYAVVYQPETDTLRWFNAQGEQGQMPRPHLPNEIDYRDMRIAPDGQRWSWCRS